MRRFAIPFVLVLALVPTYSGPALRPLLNERADFFATPIALFADEPARRSVGAMRFLEGWELNSADRAFGSISAMALDDGLFTAISDAGGVMRFRIVGGVPRAERFGDLAQGPGRGVEKLDRDAEAMAIDPANGDVWVAYERANAIWRYVPGVSRATASARPAPMRGWPENGGAEATVRLRSGAFLVFSEYARGPRRSSAALMFDRDPTDPAARTAAFGYRAPAGHRITDAIELPDGRVLTLNRRIGWLIDISAKLAVFDPRAIRPGGVVRGDVIAALRRPMTVDNFEALAVSVEEGRTIVWIASDDNFSALQRTLLMKFELEDRPGGKRPGSR